MKESVLFSADTDPFDWSEAKFLKDDFGTKGAMLGTLPRRWTPEFALIAAPKPTQGDAQSCRLPRISAATAEQLRSLAGPGNRLIVRSSVVGETIWERGTYRSVEVSAERSEFRDRLLKAMQEVVASAPGRRVGFVVQRFVEPRSRGEFGNLLRISKTRDQWEISTASRSGFTSHTRLNSQRDEAADPEKILQTRPGLSVSRLFGSIAAWLNTELLRGRLQRLNCEWIAADDRYYIVQVDEEEEDPVGINPFQIRVPQAHQSLGGAGTFLAQADQQALGEWDKLKVLEELWEPDAEHRPVLFYIPLSDLQNMSESEAWDALRADFESLIGPNGIIVRTSVRAGREKTMNLPRTECICPEAASRWCIEKRDELIAEGADIRDYAFIAHRFIASRASAWARAAPDNPTVEIHALWGLPDALQYCAYDIWEVHVPTETATEYPEFKADILISRDGGDWEHVRVKNELARNLSIGRREAVDIARRTAAIAERIGRGCHVMWFVGCVDEMGVQYNIPWYWTEAHEAEYNADRTDYNIVLISNPASLQKFKDSDMPRNRLALELKPTDLDLMRDNDFINAVGEAAREAQAPVILSGSTLAHAYYQLRAQGCAVVTRGQKDHSRVRRSAVFGKLVRDKIPARIADRQEIEVTQKVPSELVKGFLVSKLFEEAMEVRFAEGKSDKKTELADLYEVVRSLAKAEGVCLEDVSTAADEKKHKAGGFDEGLILMQTGIRGSPLRGAAESAPITPALGRKTGLDSCEIPFTFFGFANIDQTRSIIFEDFGVQLSITLKSDRIELRISRSAGQLELPLEHEVSTDTEIEE